MPGARTIRRALGATALVVALGACATPEYTATKAQRDLERLGVDRAKAQCIVKGLRAHYSDEYIRLQHQQAVAAINPKEVELYVRNKFAGQDKVLPGEIRAAQHIAAGCGVSR
jgi:hypothetical protein